MIEAGFELREIRNDGWPRSSAKPKKPGVILSFDRVTWKLTQSVRASQAFPCDTYNNWEDNLRAIALSLQALRAVDRYGVTRSGEQYQGFAQLPSGSADFDSPEVAALTMAGYAGCPKDQILESRESMERAYRWAAKVAHPDTTHGTHEDFTKLQQAKARLDKWFTEGV